MTRTLVDGAIHLPGALYSQYHGITQPDRDTELALPAENPNVGVSENPFDASSATIEKLGWR